MWADNDWNLDGEEGGRKEGRENVFGFGLVWLGDFREVMRRDGLRSVLGVDR